MFAIYSIRHKIKRIVLETISVFFSFYDFWVKNLANANSIWLKKIGAFRPRVNPVS